MSLSDIFGSVFYHTNRRNYAKGNTFGAGRLYNGIYNFLLTVRASKYYVLLVVIKYNMYKLAQSIYSW